MATITSLPPQPGSRITKWGYSFTWTDAHLSREETQPLRQQYDTLGAAALERLQAIRAAALEESKAKGTAAPTNDLYAILRDNHYHDEVLRQFWDEAHTVPSWVDWEQIERGQRFFYRYAIANIVGFALQGFVAENSASSGVVEVLVRTGGFSTRMLLGRLLETFQWLIQVTHCLAAIQPGGDGHVATIRVRLLHASVRQRILKLSRMRPDYYDVARFGVPVNTLDSIHSISTFCCNHMWLQLPKFGLRPRPEEVDDYIALFRYIGYLLATPTSYFETAEQAKRTMESLFVHELKTTETSRTVAYNFVRCVENLPSPFHVSRHFIEAGSRWMNGDELCNELELGHPGLLAYFVFAGQCALAIGLAWAQRIVPYMDELMISFFRTYMYRGVVQGKFRTRFDFKYVPQLDKKTGKEEHDQGMTGKSKSTWRSDLLFPSLSVLMEMGLIEFTFLMIFLVTGGILVGGLIGGILWIVAPEHNLLR